MMTLQATPPLWQTLQQEVRDAAARNMNPLRIQRSKNVSMSLPDLPPTYCATDLSPAIRPCA